MSKAPGQVTFEAFFAPHPYRESWTRSIAQEAWATAEAAGRADERERCAALVENIASSTDSESRAYARWFADAIRATEEPTT